MTYDPQCYPEYVNLIDSDKEREFTHQVDDAVFAIRKKLSDAKSALELRHPSHSGNMSPKSGNIHSKLPPQYPSTKPPLPSKSRSRRSHKHSPDRDSHHSRRSRSKSKPAPSSSHLSGRSHSNCSSRCSRSSGGSSTSARDRALGEKARLAALKVEAEFLKKSQKRELEKRQLEMAADQLQVEKEIAIAEAKSRVYEEHLDNLSNCSEDRSSRCSGKSERRIKLQTRTSKSIAAEELVANAEPKTQPVESNKKSETTLATPSVSAEPQAESDELSKNNNQNNLSHLNDLCKLLKIQSAPDVDMDYFPGDPLEYQ